MRQIERSAFLKSKATRTPNRADSRGNKISVANSASEAATAECGGFGLPELTDIEWLAAKHLALEQLLTDLDAPSDHLAYIRSRVSGIS